MKTISMLYVFLKFKTNWMLLWQNTFVESPLVNFLYAPLILCYSYGDKYKNEIYDSDNWKLYNFFAIFK